MPVSQHFSTLYMFAEKSKFRNYVKTRGSAISTVTLDTLSWFILKTTDETDNTAVDCVYWKWSTCMHLVFCEWIYLYIFSMIDDHLRLFCASRFSMLCFWLLLFCSLEWMRKTSSSPYTVTMTTENLSTCCCLRFLFFYRLVECAYFYGLIKFIWWIVAA